MEHVRCLARDGRNRIRRNQRSHNLHQGRPSSLRLGRSLDSPARIRSVTLDQGLRCSRIDTFPGANEICHADADHHRDG